MRISQHAINAYNPIGGRVPMKYRLTLILENQPEGGFTITCKELPELVTECDSLDEMKDNVEDAFIAVFELYEQEQRPLPESIQVIDGMDIRSSHIFETVVAINEISGSGQKTNTAWM